MPPLLSALGIGKSYGARPLFEGVDLTVEEGDRIGIVGPNGAGKTTLLRVLAGEVEPDQGRVVRRRRLRVAHVAQDAAFDPRATVGEVVNRAAAEAADPSLVEDDVERAVRVRIVLERVGFDDPGRAVSSLSGGLGKRLAIAAALARDPELLLLDEPTNHLDLDGILWLERLLTRDRLTCAVISHDRAFLQQVATRMLEVAPLYPGGVFAVAGSFSDFLVERERHLDERSQYRESLANRVRREVEWLGRGPKARTTKAQARVAEAQRLQDELRSLGDQQPGPQAGLELLGSGRKTRRLLVASGIGADVGGRRLFAHLDLLLRPGMRLGVVGANGTGKTTLLRLLAGELEPSAGSIRRADHLKVVYFDQGRHNLDPDQPLRRALAGSSDSVIYRDRPVHVVTWARRFLFRVDQLDLPVGELSGGEQARVHIARLMLEPADLLLLDEPTNDLDIPTLEALEESLLDFPGALVLVTHDRMLLDSVATLLLGLDGSGRATFFADLDQWRSASGPPVEPAPKAPRRTRAASPRPRRAGLTYLEKQEYAGIEESILAAESELETARERLEDPDVASDAELAQRAFEEHVHARERVDALYRRWAELESKLEEGS